MRRFFCNCGQELFLENRQCVQCLRPVAYFPDSYGMVTLEAVGSGWRVAATGQSVKHCDHREQYGVCNAVLDVEDLNSHCLFCRLNRTIPDLAKEQNMQRWYKLEQAKRRLLSGLLSLGLPLQAPIGGSERGLCFDFLEDQRSNPDVPDKYISTGHYQGVITINVIEADDVQRVWQREQSGERYRTLLGHMRHEVGHYYFELLVKNLAEFAQLFGSPEQPYDTALKKYYSLGALPGWQQSHISAYASAHPIEDWAECFAHYLHMTDLLETATQRGFVPVFDGANIDNMLLIWDKFTVDLNELNRSLGLCDAYPFIVTPLIADKLRFVHRIIEGDR